jgi:AraC-like DNA-binding protein
LLTTGDNPPLLSACPIVVTSERDRMIETLRHAYGARGAVIGKPDKPFTAIANRAALPNVHLHFCSYGAEAKIEFPPMAGYRLFLCMNGTGRLTILGKEAELTPTKAVILPPMHQFTACYSDDYAHLVVQFDCHGLSRHLALLSGSDGNPPIMLPTLQPLDTEKLSRLKAIALCLAYQFSAPNGPGEGVVTALEQALLSSFLAETRHHFPHLLVEQPTPTGVRDIGAMEQYMEANWNQPLTVENVAQATGVSVRSVFAAFARQRGCSPMVFLRDLRLRRAQSRLLADADVGVLSVALECGFQSQGHFAQRYREKFGELPSETQARANRSARSPLSRISPAMFPR